MRGKIVAFKEEDGYICCTTGNIVAKCIDKDKNQQIGIDVALALICGPG